MKRRKYQPPFEVEITTLGKGGTGVGTAPDGAPVAVRFAPPGGRVAVVPTGKRKGKWTARRTALIRPPAEHVTPRCPVFALCGGCALQELSLPRQRVVKQEYGLARVDEAWPARPEVAVHPARGVAEPFAYRNKVELSFGTARFLSEERKLAGDPIDGRFLGFHAPGRFDRVVDVAHCDLISEALNAVLAATRRVALADDSPRPYDARTHEGFWRHLVLRQGMHTGEILAVLYTAPTDDPAPVEAWAEAVLGVELPDGHRVVGAVWGENPGVADVARGEVRRVWGRDWLEEHLLGLSFRLSATSFFQTSTEGADLLYRTVGEAVGAGGGTLLDLYCGTGTIGLVLASGFDRVVGIEERPEAVDDARANADRNGVAGTEWTAGKVEDALEILASVAGQRTLVVDPPRAGLHPKVAKHLAGADAEVLVYVACSPASLGRDGAVLAEGGWRLTDLWTVDLFPQTGHVEMVGRFVRG